MTYFYLLEREALVRHLGVRMSQTLTLEVASVPSPAESKTHHSMAQGCHSEIRLAVSSSLW